MADNAMRGRIPLMGRRNSRDGAPETNDTMVDKLIFSNSLKTEACISAFRHVDRQHFWLPGNRDMAYQDMPLRSGRLHLSAPHIYARALESLMPLKPGMSFLNIGSGTGYFNCIVADLIGGLAVNHGIDVWPETVEHANERVARLGKDSVEFTVGNIYQLDVSKTIRYDRVYVGACANSRSKYLYRLLEVGGILIGPFQTGHSQQLRRVVRTTETQFHVEVLGSVQFATLIEPPAEFAPPSRQDTTTSEMEDISPQDGSASVASASFQAETPSRRTSVAGATLADDVMVRRDSVGLPGVPFTFALSEKPWTPERCGTYPPSFKKTVVMGMMGRPRDPLVASLPTEIWMKHIFPWCPRWWFENRAIRSSPRFAAVPPPAALAAGLVSESLALPAAPGTPSKADGEQPLEDMSDAEGRSTRAPSSGIPSTETTPESRPTASPLLQPTDINEMEADEQADSEDMPAAADPGEEEDEDEDVLFEVFDNGQRHAIGTEGDPDDIEPDDGAMHVPIHLFQLLEANHDHGRIAMWAATLEARRRLHLLTRSEDDDDSESEAEEEEDAMEDVEDAAEPTVVEDMHQDLLDEYADADADADA
eukprot:CAMPEP_0178419868 /NCGR_PEP_ID=MMETSP0689_2-20121128/25833_1 /TAXON_ID=160604 /ORGANISM="Amphidinium massartii, Strain CS-259" /LENGTH=592 /DNA_ID=CAMNT_0020041321 /DNA_START=17 /DNA_END=1792 /DNA_ORIENTATION=+